MSHNRPANDEITQAEIEATAKAIGDAMLNYNAMQASGAPPAAEWLAKAALRAMPIARTEPLPAPAELLFKAFNATDAKTAEEHADAFMNANFSESITIAKGSNWNIIRSALVDAFRLAEARGSTRPAETPASAPASALEIVAKVREGEISIGGVMPPYSPDNFEFSLSDAEAAALIEEHVSEEVAAMKAERDAAQRERSVLWKILESIYEAIIPVGPRCRDCADANGSCPHDGLPCDPGPRVIELHKRSLASLDRAKEALKSLVAQVLEYECVNNLSPSPGRKYCWDATENAVAVLASLEPSHD